MKTRLMILGVLLVLAALSYFFSVEARASQDMVQFDYTKKSDMIVFVAIFSLLFIAVFSWFGIALGAFGGVLIGGVTSAACGNSFGWIVFAAGFGAFVGCVLGMFFSKRFNRSENGESSREKSLGETSFSDMLENFPDTGDVPSIDSGD